MLRIPLGRAEVRSYQAGDAPAIVKHANNRKIWRNLRDGFPHPYKIENAKEFLELVAQQSPETFFCIANDDEAIGGIGFKMLTDVERFGAEIGYWLSESYWGQGITTEALESVTKYAIKTHKLIRLFALPYEWNKASFRVLEKVGYVCEGRLHCSAFKDGQVIDQLLYAYTVANCKNQGRR
jgi:RimJ/RimL family protein N-acetyltransferase